MNLVQLAEFIIKDDIHIYSLIILNGKLLIGRSDYKDDTAFNTDNLYAFNKITTSVVENVLLDTTHFDIAELRQLAIFKNDVSHNTIKFDVFYEEGIMNA